MLCQTHRIITASVSLLVATALVWSAADSAFARGGRRGGGRSHGAASHHPKATSHHSPGRRPTGHVKNSRGLAKQSGSSKASGQLQPQNPSLPNATGYRTDDFNPAAGAQGTSGIGSPNLRLTNADGGSSNESGMASTGNPAAMDPGQGTSSTMSPHLRIQDYDRQMFDRSMMMKSSRNPRQWDTLLSK
jgi:hypothetical protein